MKSLPHSLIPLHLADAAGLGGPDPATEIHPLAEKLRQALSAPDQTGVGTFARLVEALHAELAMVTPELIEKIAAGSDDTGAMDPSADPCAAISNLMTQMDTDDEPAEPLPV